MKNIVIRKSLQRKNSEEQEELVQGESNHKIGKDLYENIATHNGCATGTAENG
jgi:hypothetical protein